MGNYIYLSDATPIQTEAGLVRILAEGQDGKFFSLGEDVNAVFFKPSVPETIEVDPLGAFHTWSDHLRMTGRKMNPGYSQMLTVFHRTLGSRKEGLNGRWFAAPGESQADAYLRRLKADDPARHIFVDYVAELKGRWSTATEVPADKVLEVVKGKEVKYRMECEEYENLINETRGGSVSSSGKH